MKLLQINYADNEVMRDITVKIESNEALALVNLLGKMNGHAHNKLNINSDMYDCLSSVFNKENEDGYTDLPISLGTLNDK